MISAWSWVAVVPALFGGGGGEPPAWLLVREKATLTFPAPASPPEPLGAQWVAEAEGVLWYWHPERGLGRLRVSRRAPKVEEGWIAPVPRLDLPARHVVALAPWGADGIYVVEPQRYWKWSQGAWQGPWEVADRVGSAVALGSGRLVANTPEHPERPFAVLGDGGQVLTRLGERRPAPHPALLAGENSWRLARSPVDGSVFAVHRFWPLVSRWKADGTFAWERKLDSPAARMLEKRQQAFLQSEPWGQTGSCWVCRWVEVALAALVDPRGNLWLRLGEGIAVEVIAPNGEPLETVAVEGRWETPAGMSLWGQKLYVWEGSGLATFRLRKNEKVAEVRVQNRQGQPVAGAKVEVRVEGLFFEVLSDRRGRARFEAPPAGSQGSLFVTARSYRRAEREGVVPQLFEAPVVLELADTLCVQVQDAESRAPIRSFSLAADLAGSVSAASIQEGESVEIEDPEGKGCVEVAYRYPVDLRVAAEGYASWTGLIEKAPAEAVEVALEPGAPLEVTVLDPEERPVASAYVKLVPDREVGKPAYALGSDYLKFTDAQGRAVFSRLRPGVYRAEVRAREFLPFETSWKLDRGGNEQRVQLERGGTVRVTVVHKATKDPIPGVEVVLQHSQDRAFEKSCATGTTGQCALSGVPPGSIRIVARASGWSPRWQPGTVPPGEREVSFTVELQKGVRLLGRVVGIESYPESQLLALVSAAGLPVERRPLDPEGRFTVEAVPPGVVNLWVRDEKGGGELVSQFTEVPEDQESYEVELVLPPPLELTGEVLAQGQPCTGCAVELALLSAEVGAPRVERTTGPGGLFRARLPRAGLWRVRIAAPQGGPGLDEVLEVTGNLHRVFQLGEASLLVRVRNEAERPLDRAWVQVFSGFSSRLLREANSDFQGQARWTGLPAGPVRVVARHEGKTAEAQTELETGQEKELHLVLRSGRELQLRLVHGASGLPVTGPARFGIQTSQGYRVLQQGAGADGVYRLPLGDESAHALVIHAPGFAINTFHGSWGAEAGVIELRLSPENRSFSLELRGGLQACFLTVRNEAGWPLSLSVDFPPGPAPFTASSGMFNILPPGRYRVELTPCSGSPHEREIVLGPGLRPHLVFP